MFSCCFSFAVFLLPHCPCHTFSSIHSHQMSTGLSSFAAAAWQLLVLLYNNNNSWGDIYGAVIMAKPLQEFARFIWWMQTQRWGGRQPSDQANRLEPRVYQKEMAATVHIHHRHFIITQPESWYSFYRPAEGGRLSRPRHCSKGVQPVPKAVYLSGCCDKHNCLQWDLNLGPLTPQSCMLPLGHCDTSLYRMCNSLNCNHFSYNNYFRSWCTIHWYKDKCNSVCDSDPLLTDACCSALMWQTTLYFKAKLKTNKLSTTTTMAVTKTFPTS